MATKCAHCGSPNTQHEVSEIFCFDCAGKSSPTGKAIGKKKK